jgi:hypothetical protein
VSKSKAFDALDDDLKAFVLEYYVQNYDSMRAVEALGWTKDHTNPLSKYQLAQRTMRREGVREALDELAQDRIMTAQDVLSRHTEIASIDMKDVTDETGALDWAKAKRGGKTRLIKAVTTREWFDKGKGAMVKETRCEMHNAQQAQALIMKHHGLLADILKVKDLPTDPDELTALLAKQVERTTGLKVVSAAEKKEKAN